MSGFDTNVRCVLDLLMGEVRNGVQRRMTAGPEVLPVRHLGLIGRPLPQRHIDRVMDIDVLCVLDGSMTRVAYQSIVNLCEELRNLGSHDIGVSFEVKDGPMKPLPTKRAILFLHMLLHTSESYRRSPLLLVKNSWQFESMTMLGEPLSKVLPVRAIDVQTVLCGNLGILDCIRMIEQGKTGYLSWMEGGSSGCLDMQLNSLGVKEECELSELCFYGVLRGASNALRCVAGRTEGIGIDAKDMAAFESAFWDMPQASLPLRLWQAKRDMREGRIRYGQDGVSLLQEQAVEFLGHLAVHLPKMASCNERRAGASVGKPDAVTVAT